VQQSHASSAADRPGRGAACTWSRCWGTSPRQTVASAAPERRRRDGAGSVDEHEFEGTVGVSAGKCSRWDLGLAALCAGGSLRLLRTTEGATVNRQQWDEHYSGDELVWTSTPSQFLVAEVVGLPAGRAVDLSCGEGRKLDLARRAGLGGDRSGLLSGRSGEGQAVR